MNHELKLSVLIPTYNYTCYKLVYDIHEQAEQLGIDYEIIVAEDGSQYPVSIIANHKIIDLSNCRHIQRKNNVGRSAIRNFLVSEAKGEILLFMDSDGKIINNDFLKNYIDASKTHEIVCGGITHPEVCYDPYRQLRWKYEKEYEKKHGNVSTQFRSFCFLIKKEVAEKVKFDEKYANYGYEDVKYGKELRNAGYEIYCINNPLLNNDIEESKYFLKKTEQAISNAKKFENELADSIHLIQTYKKYKVIMPLFSVFFALSKPLIKKNLLSDDPSLFWFSIYKLGYYASL